MNFMKTNSKKSGKGWIAGAGRSGAALLLALMMILSALPMGGASYRAYAEGVVSDAQVQAVGADEVQEDAAQVQSPAVSSADAGMPVVSDADEPEHVCVIRSFAGHYPGEPLQQLTLHQAMSVRSISRMLPQKMGVVLDGESCADCTTVMDAEWKNVGTDRFVLELDGEKYIYSPLDDPGTEDIDESKDSPYCDLPYIAVVIEKAEDTVSGADAPAGEASASDVSASDAPVISDADVSASDVSASDAPGSNDGEQKPADDAVSDADVSASDVQPECICDQHCYADPAEGVYSVEVDCPVCSADPTACEVLPELSERELTAQTDDGRTVTVSGSLPEGALLRVLPVSDEELELITGTVDLVGVPVVHFAYDITIIYESREFQPADFGSSVKVSVSDTRLAEGEGLAVYHVGESGIERVDASVENGSVTTFEADSFSTYVALSSDISTIYYNEYAFFADAELNEQLTDGSSAYTTISDIIADTTGDITFILKSQYVVSGSETIDPGSRTVTIKGDGTYNNLLVRVPEGSGNSLTLGGGVIIDALGKSTGGAAVVVNNGAALTLNDNAVIRNGAAGGLLIDAGGSFIMNGGTITGNKDTNGAGVTNRGTMTMNGGTITGNTSEDSGGGIWQEGKFIMHGGVITGNTAQGFLGGGIFAYAGETTIQGGRIYGNVCGNEPASNGICLYHVNRAYLTLSGTPNIEDSIHCMNNSIGNMVGVNTPFNPVSVIKLSGTAANQSVACYANTIPASEMVKFAATNPSYMLKANGAFIELSAVTQAYYGGTTSGTGRLPTSWRLNFPNMYNNVLRSTGGTLFMATNFSVNTAGSGVVISKARCTVSGSNYSLSSGKELIIKRWEKPASFNDSGVLNTLTDSMIVATTGGTSGKLVISDVVLDGSNRPWIYTYNNTSYSLPGVQSVNNAMLRVEGSASLELKDGVILRDAPASPYGGAINAESGTLIISGNVTFSNNKATTYGKAIRVNAATVNINTPTITNPDNEDIYLVRSTSKLNINTNLSSVLPITIDPNDTASCAKGRVIATYASGYTPDPTKFVVQNVDCVLVRSGQNIIIGDASYTNELTAHAEDITPDAGEARTFTLDLTELYGTLANVRGKAVSISNVKLTSGSIDLLDFQTVEDNKRTYGHAESNRSFGISTQLTGGSHAAQDIGSTSATIGSSASEAKLVFTIHSGNAITVDGEIGEITFDLSVGSSVRPFTVTLYAHSGYTISAEVPLSITGVVDIDGTFYLPSGEEYRITNSGTVPLVLTDVEWTWLIDGAHDANELFSNHENITMSVNLGNALSGSFGKTAGYQWSGINSPIPARSGEEPGALSLDWAMSIGSNNSLISKQGATIASITYTIDVKN